MENVYNNYGAAISAKDFVATHASDESFKKAVKSENNLTVRKYIASWGFNRVSRDFADAVIKAA